MTADLAGTDLKPLLEYAVSTTPHPLSASAPDPDGTVAHGALDILITNTSTQAVYCHSIQILLPVGESAQDLTANPDSIAPHVVPADTWQGDWSTVAPQDDVVVLIPATETSMFPAPGTRAATTGTPAETTSTAATPLYVAQTKAFTLTPAQGQADPVEITTRGLHLHLSNIPINREPGIATIHILENSGTTADKDTFQERRMHHPVAKYSYRPPAMTQPEGVGRNLVALRAGGADQSTPVTLTTTTTGFYLRWAHYDGEYHQLYADGKLISGVEYNGSRWPTEGGITVTRDITYALKTAVSDDTGANVTRWDYLTLPAEHPTYPEGLTVAATKNLIANGPIQANDTVTVGGKVDAKAGLDVSGGKLDAKAGLDVSGGKLDAKAGVDVSGGKLDAKAGLDVSGGKVDAKAGLDVTGQLNAKGGLTIPANATLAVNGTVEMLGGITLLKEYSGSSTQQLSYTAPTDGLVIGYCDIYSSKLAVGWAHCLSNNLWMSACATASLEWGRVSGTGSFTTSVRRGQPFTIQHIGTTVYGDNAHFTTKFYWIPLGKEGGNPTVKSVEPPEDGPGQVPHGGIEAPTMPAADTPA